MHGTNIKIIGVSKLFILKTMLSNISHNNWMKNNVNWKISQLNRKMSYSWACTSDFKDYDNYSHFLLHSTYSVHVGHVATTPLHISFLPVHLLRISPLFSSFHLCGIFLEMLLTSSHWSSSYFQCSSLQRTVQQGFMPWNLQGSWNDLTRILKTNIYRGCGEDKTSPTTVDSETSDNQTVYGQLD